MKTDRRWQVRLLRPALANTCKHRPASADRCTATSGHFSHSSAIHIYERDVFRTFAQLATEVQSTSDSVELDLVTNVMADRRLNLALRLLDDTQKRVAADESEAKSKDKRSSGRVALRLSSAKVEADRRRAAPRPSAPTWPTSRCSVCSSSTSSSAMPFSCSSSFHFLQTPQRFRSTTQQLSDEKLVGTVIRQRDRVSE